MTHEIGSTNNNSERRSPHIVIEDGQTGLPFSKGLHASEVMVTGLSPSRAYQVAEVVEERLLARRAPSVSSDELSELTLSAVEELAGERYAENYRRWREGGGLGGSVGVVDGGPTRGGEAAVG